MQGDDTIQYNYNPIKIYEVYIDETGKERGYEIQHLTIIKCIERYGISFEFIGKALTIWTFSNDGRINRDIALHFATSVALGTITRHRVSTADLVGFFTRQQKAKR